MKTKQIFRAASVCLSFALMAQAPRIYATSPAPLFDGGKTGWTVVIPAKAAPPVAFAAQELTNALFRISGAAFPIATNRPANGPCIRIEAGDGEWGDEVAEYRLDGCDLLISGNQPRAALHAAYAFLQRELGVRWLWPGEDGSFYPERKSWTFPKGFGFRHTPSIRYRGFHHCGDWRDRGAFNLWQTRNFAVIHRHGVWKTEARFGQYSMLAQHNANLRGEKELFREHPECFAELGGSRAMANICFSSDLAAEKVAERLAGDLRARKGMGYLPPQILEIFPADNQDYCQCASCREKGVSTGWFGFYNKVVAILAPQFPGLRFATLAYQGYRDVPAEPVKMTEFVEYASHGRCHIHPMEDPNCKANADEMRKMRDWCARGGVPVGHYSYEYDSISRHNIFMPFFTMVGTTVETSAKLGLVTLIPEVGLSPLKGPDIEAHAIQNRLTILYFARKMWDASLTLDDFLSDTSRCAYGPAAAPMKEYFLLLDDAWGRMDGRIGLFADGMHVAAKMLRDDAVRKKAGDLLADAERLAASDARSLRNVLREKALYGQMLAFRALAAGNDEALHLPRLGMEDEFDEARVPWRPLRNAEEAAAKTAVRGCWRYSSKEQKNGRTVNVPEELFMEWRGAREASLEIEGADGERYFFRYADGARSQRKISEVGVEEERWSPGWEAAERDGRVAFRIPFSAFRRAPESGATWRGRISSGDLGLPPAPTMTVRLVFVSSGSAERPIIYCPGETRPDRRAQFIGSIPGLRVQCETIGWDLIACTNTSELAESVAKADTFMFQVPTAECVTPEIAAAIREKVKAGGTLYARSYWNIPLAALLGDPALKSHVADPKDFPLALRRAKWVLDGDWCRKPWNLENSVRHSYAPCYMQVPDSPQGEWIEYAAMPSKRDPEKMLPFLSALRYGDGVVIIAGESLNVSPFLLIDNIRRHLLGD